MMLFVAQAGLNHKALWPTMLYLAGILLIIGVGIAVLAAFRRWSRSDHGHETSAGLTLGQARQMKARGLLTDHEFDQIKRVIIESNTSSASSGNPESAL